MNRNEIVEIALEEGVVDARLIAPSIERFFWRIMKYAEQLLSPTSDKEDSCTKEV